jgi:conserved oligomeric Golgi complex subunit 6
MASNDGSSHGPSNILADKVARALQVRTDTIAMKSALDALAQAELDGDHGGTVVDAKNVRAVMERDALQQALLLQEELDGILNVVTTLRQGCTEVAETAAKLVEVCNTSVISKASSSTVFASNKAIADEEGPVTSPQEDEKKLAATLSEAFALRDSALQRLRAVDTFLDKFDLSDSDSALLESYNFEDVTDLTMAMETDVQHGTAFLAALERVRHIRSSLQESFGADEGLGANSALRIIESLSQKQERAYERLYQWLQLQNQEDFPFAHPFVQRALATLRHVPAFYSHTVELVAGSRRAVVTRQFLLALTTGIDDSPPIELKAHDPVACKFFFVSVAVVAVVPVGLLSSSSC